MPTPAYLNIKAEKSGDIKGSVKVKGREDSIEVLAFSHEIQMPTDPQTGRLAGVRRHLPLVITKAFDKSSPLLYQLVCSGENLTDVTIKWFAIQPDGKEANWYTHKLKNAQITSVRAIMPDIKDPDNQHLVPTEEVAFRYQEITWEVTDGGIMATDSWDQSRD